MNEESQKILKEKLRLFRNLSNNNSFKKARNAIALFVLAVVSISSLYLANRVKQTPQPQNASAAGLSTVNIMNVYYFPTDSQYANNKIRAFQKSLAAKIYIENASAYHGDQTKKMISFNDTDQYIRDTARPTGADSLEVVRAILNDKQNGLSVCELIDQKKLDQIWIWADPDKDPARVTEWEINNVTSNYGSTGIYNIGSLCPNTKRTFSFLNLAYNVPVTNAVHSFAHYMEGLITGIEGYDMLAGRFRGTESVGGQNAKAYAPYVPSDRCGSVHVPPNVPWDPATNLYLGYQYNLPNIVSSSCANWNPDGTGAKTPVSVDTWRAVTIPSTTEDSELQTFNSIPQTESLDQLKYLTWWLQQFPHESSGISFEGKKLPSWWAFVSNTDDVINAYLGLGYWFKPDLKAPVSASQTAMCAGTSGYYSSCTYTPGSSTLGAHTENNQVLAATNYGDIALVTVAYGSTTVSVSNITFCGDPMTRVGTGPSNGGGMKTEMWYRLSPQSGVCPVTVRFSSDPGQRIVTTTVFNNIDQTTPVTGIKTGGFSGPYTATPGSITATLTGPKDSLMVCTYALYSEQSNPPSGNNATAKPGTTQLWKFEDPNLSTGDIANIWAGIGAGVQRATANQSTTLSWKTVKKQPQSYTCANLNVKPFGIVMSTPAPTTTPTPTVAPTIAPTVAPTPTPITYYLVPKNQITAVATSQHIGYEVIKSIDANNATFWHSEWTPVAPLPQWVTMTLPNVYKVGKIGYLPRQDNGLNGTITGYRVLVSKDGLTSTVAAEGTWPLDTTLKSVTFTPVDAKYVALVATSGYGGNASAAELAVWYTSVSVTPTQSPVPTVVPTATPSTSYYQIAPQQLSVVGTSQQVGYESSKATDGNTSTFWHSSWSPYAPLPQSLSIGLGGQFPISKIVYTPRQDGSSIGNITSYKISLSNNGITYSPVATGTWANDQTAKTVTFFPTFSNFVRLEAIAGTSGYASAADISVWQTPINLSYSSTATATSQHVGYEAARAADTSTATFWHSEWSPYSALPQSLTLNLGKQFIVKGLVYLPRQDGGIYGTITSYKVYTSLDGVTYKLAYTGTWPDDTVYKTVMFTPINASYVKLQVDAGDGRYASAALLAIIY